MKFKTQKEVKEEVQEENKSNPIHEYLDFVNYAKAQFRVLSNNKLSKIHICILALDDKIIKSIFNWEPNNDYALVNKGTFEDFVNLAYTVCSEWVNKYNNITKDLGAYECIILSTYASPLPAMVADIFQAYRDLKEDPDKAKEKWYKCE